MKLLIVTLFACFIVQPLIASSTLDPSELLLYQKPTCPYCQKVFYFLDALQLEIEMADTRDLEVRAELIRRGGKAQVPCLMIQGAPLYESDEIIRFLQEQYASLTSR